MTTSELIAQGARKPVFLGDSNAPKMEMPVIKQWFADRGDETLRVEYPLTRDSVVLDVGGYEGNWAWQIHERYGCVIHVFEPVGIFADKIEQRFRGRENVHVHRYGLADKTSRAVISINNDSSSVHKSKGEPCEIELRQASDVFSELNLDRTGVDLIKINIEGCEYELVTHLATSGAIKHIRDIQVQFHDFVPEAARRMHEVHQHIEKTHELTWQYRFVWDNWRRRQM
jgi:FkbM family methyltransferase